MKDDVAQATYYYAEGHEEIQPAYVRKLHGVVKRLELLGYTLANCKRYYEEGSDAVVGMPFAQPVGKYQVPFLFLLRYQVNRISAGWDKRRSRKPRRMALRQAGDMVD